jgi:hypothetical protein
LEAVAAMSKPKPKPPMPVNEITRHRFSESNFEMLLTIYDDPDEGLKAAIAKLKAQFINKRIKV